MMFLRHAADDGLRSSRIATETAVAPALGTDAVHVVAESTGATDPFAAARAATETAALILAAAILIVAASPVPLVQRKG